VQDSYNYILIYLMSNTIFSVSNMSPGPNILNTFSTRWTVNVHTIFVLIKTESQPHSTNPIQTHVRHSCKGVNNRAACHAGPMEVMDFMHRRCSNQYLAG
jgi:hypothetical protein